MLLHSEQKTAKYIATKMLTCLCDFRQYLKHLSRVFLFCLTGSSPC